MTSVKADRTRIASTVINGSITNTELADASMTSAKIADASIQCADLAQNGASEGQVLKLIRSLQRISPSLPCSYPLLGYD